MKNLLKFILSRIMTAVILISCCLSNINISVFGVDKSRVIDIWDFGFVEETEDYYNNNITKENLETTFTTLGILNGVTQESGTKEMNFGDFTLNFAAKNRFYNTSSNTYGNPKAKYKDDKYNSNGYYDGNGTGGENRKYVVIKNVKAGDTLIAYTGWSNVPSGNGDKLICVSLDGKQKIETEPFTESHKSVFIAKQDGDFKFYTTTDNGGKLVYFRFARVPSIIVSGTITGDVKEGFGIKFQNKSTNDEIEAEVNGNEYTAILPTGFTFNTVMTGVSGYGISYSTKTVETKLSDVAAGKIIKDFVAEKKSTYTLSGSVIGFKDGYDTSKLEITFKAAEDEETNDVNAAVNKDNKTFSAVLEAGVHYTSVMDGVNDYKINSGGIIFVEDKEQTKTQDITVGEKEVYDISGKFIGITDIRGVYKDLDITPQEITFTNVDDKYVYNGIISKGSFSGKLRTGSYEVAIKDGNYKTSNHIIVEDSAVNKDILCEYTGTAEKIDYKSDIYVGADKDYKTVQSAVNAVKTMGERTKEQRVNIHIAPGIYREQVLIDTPYISLINDTPDKKVLITWYYGIGCSYYSCKNGYYNPYNDYDKYEKGSADKWGAAVYIKESADGFIAENIHFESSFNKYMTDEEVDDGVTVSTEEKPQRTISSIVTNSAFTEHASAFATEANENDFYKCVFSSSQYTLYTGSGNCNSYFKNCKIIGQTDYIFGDGNCVFDACELQWCGYTDQSRVGYITAAKDTAANGYLFRGCTITGADMENSKITVAGGALGRPLGQNAKVAFLDTKLAKSNYLSTDIEFEDLNTSTEKKNPRWANMSGAVASKANFIEYNTSYNNNAITEFGVSTINRTEYNVEKFLGGFKPAHYSKDLGETPVFKTDPYIWSNGDLNTPNIGNTFEARYETENFADNDVSAISWYRVDTEGKETLICTSSVNISNHYQSQREDAGCYLKFIVTPITIDGQKGESFSRTTEHTLGSTWIDPSNPNEPEPGKGINIFLAGDSTVKDYSANGMYNGGKIEDKGSWGEFLQNFFNSDNVTVLNYANGGRSTRNFMNEGTLAKIEANIKEGDYLFFQFAGNDAANQSGYLADRYVPLVPIDEQGNVGSHLSGSPGEEIFPTVGPAEGYHSASLDEKGNVIKGNLTYNCGATFKWYLKQYIDAAKKKGATPVIVVTIARNVLERDGSGKIRVHCDSTDTTTNTYVSINNAYVRATRQLAEEEGVRVIDLFDITTDMYETAYANDPGAAKDKSPYVDAAFCGTDGTHSSKLGGIIQAGRMARVIQDMNIDISKYIVHPSSCEGLNNTGTMFTVTRAGEFKAYDNSYVYHDYWTKYGQSIFDDIKANENKGNTGTTGEGTTIIGDANMNNDLDTDDAASILKIVLDKSVNLPIQSEKNYMEIVDVNNDGILTALDASMVLKKALDKSFEFPARK